MGVRVRQKHNEILGVQCRGMEGWTMGEANSMAGELWLRHHPAPHSLGRELRQ